MINIKKTTFQKREYYVDPDFDNKDKTSYDGEEIFLYLSDDTEDWLIENHIVVFEKEERLFGTTCVIPYIQEEGIKFWISDPKREEKLKEEKERKQKEKIELMLKRKAIEDAKPEFYGVYSENGLFLVDKANFIKIKKREPNELDMAINKDKQEFEGIYCVEILDIINAFEK